MTQNQSYLAPLAFNISFKKRAAIIIAVNSLLFNAATAVPLQVSHQTPEALNPSGLVAESKAAIVSELNTIYKRSLSAKELQEIQSWQWADYNWWLRSNRSGLVTQRKVSMESALRKVTNTLMGMPVNSKQLNENAYSELVQQGIATLGFDYVHFIRLDGNKNGQQLPNQFIKNIKLTPKVGGLADYKMTNQKRPDLVLIDDYIVAALNPAFTYCDQYSAQATVSQAFEHCFSKKIEGLYKYSVLAAQCELNAISEHIRCLDKSDLTIRGQSLQLPKISEFVDHAISFIEDYRLLIELHYRDPLREEFNFAVTLNLDDYLNHVQRDKPNKALADHNLESEIEGLVDTFLLNLGEPLKRGLVSHIVRTQVLATETLVQVPDSELNDALNTVNAALVWAAMQNYKL